MYLSPNLSKPQPGKSIKITEKSPKQVTLVMACATGSSDKNVLPFKSQPLASPMVASAAAVTFWASPWFISVHMISPYNALQPS